MSERTFGDMSEEFEFDEDAEYLDRPVSGWLRRKRAVSTKEDDVEAVLAQARARRSGTWLSILEDRRSTATSICRLVEVDATVAPPVVSSLQT
jgi:hypothetical protein